ncbi:methyl-accepting chemotaxis protein [Brevundimonas sp. GCM10030266]|uniref:methyl-accepting chemotaxis protein n=1 Tax=Brevundimonas sp. GCM10030266 TaxID=3273386 RepID=UPI0036123AA1
MKTLTIGKRISLLTLLAVAGLLIVLGLALMELNSALRTQIADRTQKTVEVAHSVVAHFHAQQVAGLMTETHAKEAAKATLKDLRYAGTDYFWINDMHPNMVMHPTNPKLDGTDITENTDADGVKMFQKMVEVVRADGEGFVSYQWNKPNEEQASPKISFVKGFAPWGWVIGSGVYTDEIAALVGKTALALGLMALVVVLAMAVGGVLIGRSVSRPVVALSSRMRSLAAGDKTSAIPGLQRGDEVGQMAAALETFRDAAITAERLEAEAVSSRSATETERARNQQMTEAAAQEQAVVVAALGEGLDHLMRGDLTYSLTQPFPPHYAKLQNDFNAAIAQLKTAMSVVVTNVSAIRSGSGEISHAADDLSRRTEQQAASLEETAAALDEITATVNRTAAGARQASQTVQAAKGDAETSGDIVRDAVGAMSAIEKSSQEISQIVGVIDEIAFQTNLLALNAGVEAARAGDSGRGFAVVASEVRALAQRSADAAKEIKTLISASTQQVNAGVNLVGQTGEALQRIVSRVAEIDGLVSEIAASAQEQATGLQQVNTAVNQMDQVTQQNAAMVEESTAASHSLSQEAEVLAGSVSRFRIGDAPQAAAAPTPRPAARHASVPQMRTVGQGGAALKSHPAEDGWEEF